MNIYVELTFVLNLAFTREKVFDCEEILALCEESDANLILPAYSLIEAYETLLRRKESFGRIKEDIEKKPKPTESTKYSESELRDLIEMSTYLTNSVDNDLKNFKQVQSRLLKTAELIPLDAKVIEHASQYREKKAIECPPKRRSYILPFYCIWSPHMTSSACFSIEIPGVLEILMLWRNFEISIAS